MTFWEKCILFSIDNGGDFWPQISANVSPVKNV